MEVSSQARLNDTIELIEKNEDSDESRWCMNEDSDSGEEIIEARKGKTPHSSIRST